MPSKPRWHADISQIRRTVAAMAATPFFDRATFEKLFSIKPRQANNLMRELAGFTLGGATVIRREDLLERLDQVATKNVAARSEIKRKTRVLDALEELRRDRPRRIVAPPRRRAKDPLPVGVQISAPGEMKIQFSSPEELLSRLLGLAESASADFASFADGLGPCFVGSDVLSRLAGSEGGELSFMETSVS